MKKILLTLLAASACLSAAAIPAKPGNIPYVLPDGTTVQIRMHGDEFYHYMTDAQGQVIELGADGYFHPAQKPSGFTRTRAFARRRAADAKRRSIRTRAAAEDFPMTHGVRHIPVLLAYFSDRSFKIESPATTFEKQLNENGYSAYGATGSVQDFYLDNSHGLFTPVFDVYGPVQVSGSVASYGRNDEADRVIYEAATKLDNEIDFSRYDTDGDGNVDMILLYYAGYNEAEGASNTIWPHSWDMGESNYSYVANNRFDGVHIGNYFCTSELTGTYGTNIDGIGTTCHEFAHSLGLPDFYDTDYDDYNGEAGSLYAFSTMDAGPYNNDGRTPPYFNAEERRMLGWDVTFDNLPLSGTVTIPPIQQEDLVYQAGTATEGEYFLYECRNGQGWDAYIQPGLLVYHVDKSEVRTVQVYDQENGRNVAVTPHDLWYDWETYNCINANASHPCFYLVPAAKQGQVSYSSDLASSPGKIPFPGTAGVSTFTPADWEKSEALYSIGQIRLENGNVSMKVQRRIRSLSGKVKDLSGNPVAGATVTLTLPEPEAAAAARRLIRRVSGEPLAVTATDRNGDYSFDLTEVEGSTFLVAVSAEGYFGSSRNVTLNGLSTTAGFVLRGLDEPEISDLSKFNPDATPEGVGFGYAGDSIMGAVCFTAEELAPFAGRRIDAISFMYTSSSVKGAYGIVDFGSSRVATVPVSAPVSEQWNTVDVSGVGLRIPDGEDVWFGYALEESKNGYPLLVDESGNEAGGFYYSSFSLTSSSWKESTGNILVSVSLAPSEIDLAYLGFNYIENPKDGVYADGDYFALRLVESYRKRFTAVQWFYDDEPVAGDTVRLRTGTHVVEARLTLSDGSSKVVELPLTVR